MGDGVVNFFLVRVEFDDINEQTGKLKKIKTQYLVDAMTCTEAEARTHQYLKGTVMDYEIVSAVKSPIEDVIRVEVPN
jgi:hypothetical protein